MCNFDESFLYPIKLPFGEKVLLWVLPNTKTRSDVHLPRPLASFPIANLSTIYVCCKLCSRDYKSLYDIKSISNLYVGCFATGNPDGSWVPCFRQLQIHLTLVALCFHSSAYQMCFAETAVYHLIRLFLLQFSQL